MTYFGEMFLEISLFGARRINLYVIQYYAL